ncbi:MAG: SNF2-related protein [Rhodospirillales bacterium]
MTRGRRARARPYGSDLRLDEPGIREQFDAATFGRGDEYQRRGAVLELSIEPDEIGARLRATVRGSGSVSYRVEVDLTPTDEMVVCEGFCTCPVEADCKHVVAALLAAVRGGLFGDFADRTIPAPPRAEPTGPSTPPLMAAAPLAGALGRWLDRLDEAAAPADPADGEPKSGPPPETILYCFHVHRPPGGPERTALDVVAVRPLKAGGWGAGRPMRLSAVATSTARSVADVDRAVARVLTAMSQGALDDWPAHGDPDTFAWAMERILATGRARWEGKDGVTLARGADRPGRLAWRLDLHGNQIPGLEAGDPALAVLPGPVPWAVDPATGACGRLLLDLPQPVLSVILAAPPVPAEAAAAVADTLRRRFPDGSVAPPRADVVVTVDDSPPVPVLRLTTRTLPPLATWGRRGPPVEERVDAAWLSFDYAGTEIPAGTPPADVRRVVDRMVRVQRRRPDVEGAAIARLAALGFGRTDPHLAPRLAKALEGGAITFPLAYAPRGYGEIVPVDPLRWPAFVHRDVPELEAAGWRVLVGADFRHRTVSADGEWQADLEDRGGWWFSLDLGIEVEGERIALLPILVSALARLGPGGAPQSLAPDGTLYAPLPDGRTLAIPFERVRRLVEVLFDLFAERPPGAAFDLSLVQALALEEIAEATRLRRIGGTRLRELAASLRDGGPGAGTRAEPAGLRAELRPYQRVGFGWMGFLAAHGLGGVLADDMGLGKTVQTLAHVLAEKASGRMEAPVLVVAPTSLVATWRDEAARFTPDLRVVIMHGQKRPRGTGAFDGADLVVTTYPLLPRDGDLLGAVTWHAVVLDEAQAIKNPTSQWTRVACRLKAGHRLCLTGTPVENHLGEIWSLFAFLMPGLLGDLKTFNAAFRAPIERRNDTARRGLLSRRLKPFLLRRTKTEVAAELPPKTEMVRWIELTGDQRDLYETLRLAMDAKVRSAIAEKGAARSSIVVLDALLKLRQACCDPRLVRSRGTAKAPPESAKLAHLMDLLPPLVEEGRRILVFSQFTGMLDLIRPELKRAGIAFVELRGDTTDRETPVKAFQTGAVPVFLISLKAGGVGLTLTAADTVIHYDPWWNPAAEDQATDRAHRIGQDKPVFVYKLIAAGTVEQRMLDLQSRKRAVAAALYDADTTGTFRFSEEDLAALFEPIA